ncbi:protein LYRIC-like [Cebidichthys violaceus]|uniref:protein LYRIC-like n=1 Tax=Cebidichthys violaceus TaxID=271503 RepID=UPI0035CA767C
MTGVHHSLNGTQSEIGLSLESSVGQGRQDTVSNGSAEEERDSGDSLFITQKTGTLPEAGRSGRRPLYSRRSKPVSPRDLEESEDSSSSTSCDEELKTHKWRRRRKYSLPKYSFPFLQERKLQSGPLPDQNKSLHNYTIGGFFKCLGELRQSSRRGENLESSLPTVDMDGENLSMLSEEEGERSEDEDIKVVERKHFVASAKMKSQQTWCNQLKEQRRRKIDTQKGKASKPVAEQAGPRPGSQRLLHRPPDRTAVTKVKKRRKEESEGLRVAASMNMEAKETPSLSEGCRAAKTSDVLEVNGKNVMEGSSGADNTLRQEERDIPDSTQKKKRKNNKSRAESVGQEVDVRVDDSVVSVRCNVEDDGKKKKKKKKKKRKRSGEDVELLQSGAVAEPLNDDADIQKKKKKRKKELGIVITEEHEVEEASNRTLDLSPVSTEPLEASGHCSENAAIAQETVASSFVKRKKHKKKQQSFSNNAPRDGEEGADVSFDLDDDSVTLAKDSGTSLKKKRKSLSEGRYFSSYTPEEKGKFKNVYHQKTNEDLEEQNAEPVTKKKSEIFSRGVSEDKVVQSDDSASAREKEKKRNSSFLVADAEENDVEELNDGVTKRKRKRKTSAEQHSVENGHEQDCEEPDETRRGALPQSTDTGRKKKKKRTGSESEGLDGAANAAFSPHDEVLKKKKKKCNDVMKEGPPTTTTCSSVSRKEKGKRCGGVKVSHDGSTHASTEMLTSVECDSASSEMPGSQASKDARDKKKKLQNEGKSSTESAELEPIENKMKQKERNNQSTTPETSDIVKKKHRKLKWKLHNPNKDFFTDC